MRVAIINGNGHCCDKCGEVMLPKDVIHIHAKVLHDDVKKASTGFYTTISKMDLCKDCYDKIFKDINIQEPRK